MTERKSRKVLIINNIKSDTIDQAIFILKGDAPLGEISTIDTSIAKEAQEIIDRYVKQVERLKRGCSYQGTAKQKKTSRFSPWPLFFFISSILSVVLSISLIYSAG